MPSHYVKTVQAEVKRQLTESRAVHTQMCLDAAMIAANEVFNMGPSRAEAFCKAFSSTMLEIASITVEDTADMEYTKTKVDEALKRICGEHFQPWEERYG